MTESKNLKTLLPVKKTNPEYRVKLKSGLSLFLKDDNPEYF